MQIIYGYLFGIVAYNLYIAFKGHWRPALASTIINVCIGISFI